MIIEIVSFDMPPGFDDNALMEDARSVAGHWQANPDLIRKHFAKSEDGKVAGIYIWPEKAAALSAHDADWIKRFRARTGSEPSFTYFDMFMLIDNEAGTVSEFPLEDQSSSAPSGRNSAIL